MDEKEYIEREALFKTVEDYASTHPVMNDNELFSLFCSIPAADVRPVVGAAWQSWEQDKPPCKWNSLQREPLKHKMSFLSNGANTFA